MPHINDLIFLMDGKDMTHRRLSIHIYPWETTFCIDDRNEDNETFALKTITASNSEIEVKILTEPKS